MSVIASTTGETINLNDIYHSLMIIVPKCGQIIRDAFFKEKTVKDKECFADFVTETDEKVEQVLIEFIKQKYPKHRFIGEETSVGKVDFTDEPVWIVDPVDGTTNFVHRFPHCALSIAFFVNREAQIGVIFDPIRDELYSAVRGQGSFLNGRTLVPSGQKELNKSQIITEFGSSRMAAELDTKASNMRNLIGRVHSLRLLGSAALNACYVANGCGDLYYEYGIHIWDMAAACLIASEAGCVVCDPESGGPLDVLSRRIMIAASQDLVDQVRPLIKTVFYPSD